MSEQSEPRPQEQPATSQTRPLEPQPAPNPPPRFSTRAGSVDAPPRPPEKREHHRDLWAIIATIVAVLALLMGFIALAVAKTANDRLDDVLMQLQYQQRMDSREDRHYQRDQSQQFQHDCGFLPYYQQWGEDGYLDEGDIWGPGIPEDYTDEGMATPLPD